MTLSEPTLFGVPLALLNSSATFVNLIYILEGFLHMNSFCFVVLKNFASIKAMRFIERKQSRLHLFLRDCAVCQMQLLCQYKKTYHTKLCNIFCRYVAAIYLQCL